MKMKKSKDSTGGPSSAIGIMKFKESVDSPQLSPETVVIFVVIMIIIVIIIKSAVGI
jgi:preprotein translocase subunit Sec61beta